MRLRLVLSVAAVLVGGGLIVPASAGATLVQTPTISASFGASQVPHDSETTLSFTIYNPNQALVSPPTFGFATTLPADNGTATMQIPQDAGFSDTCGGSVQSTSTSVTYSGGTAAAQSICVVSFNVIATDPGIWTDSVELTASNGGTDPATADLTIVGGAQSHVDFSTILFGGPRAVRIGDTLPLSVTISNPNATVPLNGIGFSDDLPAGFEVASPAGKSQTCDTGTVAADPGGHTFALTGATLGVTPDPSAQCSWTIQVTAVKDGFWSDPLGRVGSTEGGSGDPVQDATISVLGGGPRVLWSNASAYNQSGSFGFAELNGSGAGDLLSAGSFKYHAEGFALDLADSAIYFVAGKSDGDTGLEIYRSHLDGTDDATDLRATNNALYPGLAIDQAAHRLYYEDSGTHTFSYIGIKQVEGEDVDVAGHQPALGGMAIDDQAGRIYWSNSSEIAYSDLNGSNPHTIVTNLTAHLDNPVAVAVDTSTQRIYWANYVDSTIGWASLDGKQQGVLDTSGVSIDEPQGIALDPDTNRLYWTNSGLDSISWEATDGSVGGTLDTDGSVVYLPDALALLYPPTASGAATVTGGTALHATLNCAAQWAADRTEAQLYRAPQSVTTRWLRSGTPIAGATTSTYQPTSAGSYSCQQTASNDAGSAISTSASHAVDSAPTTGRVKVHVSRHSATVRFSGAGHHTGFQCRLKSARHRGAWTRCKSPRRYRHLRPGRYQIAVRAVGPGGTDRSPSHRAFRIR